MSPLVAGVAGLVTRSVAAIQLRSEMDASRVLALCGGAVPGIFAGVAMMMVLPLDALRMLAGAATVVCGVWLALPMGRPGRPGTLLVAAIAGNAVGVAIARRLDRDRFRRVVIAFVIVAGLTALVP